MPRGGYRPGAGRPKGSKSKLVAEVRSATAAGLSPLDFLLETMRDEGRDFDVGMRAAGLALPYVHRRADAGGKKEQAEEAARTVERGTSWEELLAH